jgi:hypothetical protein
MPTLAKEFLLVATKENLSPFQGDMPYRVFNEHGACCDANTLVTLLANHFFA